MRIALLLTFGLLTSLKSYAITDSVRFVVNFGLHKSIIIPHRDTLKAPAQGAYPFSLEASFSWLNYSTRGWEKANAYCNNGVAIGYTNFQKPHILGQGYYFMLYTEPQITLNKKINLSWTAGVGMIRLTDVFDAERNPTNRFYSNPLSGLLRIGIKSSFTITPNWCAVASLSYNHISNGGTRTPNLGMNYPTASVYLEYHFSHIPLPNYTPDKSYDPSLHWTAQFFTASRLIKAWDANSGRKRMTGLTAYASRQFTHTNAWLAGVEASHDESLPATGAFFGDYYEPTIVSLIGGHQLSIGRVKFTQALGVYLYKNYENPNAIFQRYTLMYQLAHHFQVGFSLKAHAEIAEMLDVRLGITF
jgi:hypothetical protein